MIPEVSLSMITNYVESVSEHNKLGISISDNMKYVIDLKGRIVATVSWCRNFYDRADRAFDTYDYYFAIKTYDERVLTQVMKSDENTLIVDAISLYWTNCGYGYARYFESTGTYLTSHMLMEQYGIESVRVEKVV